MPRVPSKKGLVDKISPLIILLNHMKEKIKSQWKPGEWNEFRKKLDNLSLEELRELTTKVGIEFTGGNENVVDTRNLTAKEQFILVLDEADKKELFREYKAILQKQK